MRLKNNQCAVQCVLYGIKKMVFVRFAVFRGLTEANR